MLRPSGLVDRLHDLFLNQGDPLNGIKYQIYGDSAYPWGDYTKRSYKGRMTQAQYRFCCQMNPTRQAVENGFGHLLSLWSFLNFHPRIKLQKTPVGRLFWVAAILSNLHVIPYGDAITARYGTTSFGLDWERYLHEFPLRCNMRLS